MAIELISHSSCCVNGDDVPIARSRATTRTGGILEVFIGGIVIGNVDIIVGIDGD